MFGNAMIFTLLVGMLVMGGVFALLAAFFRKEESGRASERLDLLVGRNTRKDSSSDMLLKQALQEVDKKNILDKLTPSGLNLGKMLEQADANVQPSALMGVALASSVVGGVISAWLVNIYVLPVGAAVCGSVPFVWLWWKRKARLAKFAAQLSDAMELTARALRAGHSLAAGMHVVAEEMPPPISKEFGRIYEEQNLGISLDDAFKGLCDRVPNLDLKFFVTAVAIQRQTGGDLAEILDRIGYVIRERFKIQGQVKALSAEGRLSGVVLIALPIGLFIMLLFMKPDYISELWTDPMGIKMSIFAIVMMLIGSYAIKKCVDIKV
ncbi:MAG: type II secretion system F family protein [Gemmataceae bacterium]